MQKEWTELACAREFNRMLREFGADPEQIRNFQWSNTNRMLNRSYVTWTLTRPGHDLSAQEWTTLWIERASWFSEQDRPPTWTATVSSTEPGEAAQGRPSGPSRWAELLPGVTLWATQWEGGEAIDFAIEHISPGASHATWTPVRISERVNHQHESKGEAAQRWIYEHPLVGELISRAPSELSPELAAVRAALGRYWDK